MENNEHSIISTVCRAFFFFFLLTISPLLHYITYTLATVFSVYSMYARSVPHILYEPMPQTMCCAGSLFIKLQQNINNNKNGNAVVVRLLRLLLCTHGDFVSNKSTGKWHNIFRLIIIFSRNFFLFFSKAKKKPKCKWNEKQNKMCCSE